MRSARFLRQYFAGQQKFGVGARIEPVRPYAQHLRGRNAAALEYRVQKPGRAAGLNQFFSVSNTRAP